LRYRILGDNLQIVIVELEPGEVVYGEAGTMNHMSGNIQMNTRVIGGFWKGIKRMLMRESFFMTEFTPVGGRGFVAFNGRAPGKIKALKIEPGREFMVQKDAFLAAESTVDLDIAFVKKLGAGFFGGEGFILEKLSGSGTVFIHACGDFIEYNLAPGQLIKVDTGHIVGFDSTVDYDIAYAGSIKTALFGGEGIFLATLRGPGRVILQSMNVALLASALRPYFPSTSGGGGVKIGPFGLEL